MFVYIPKATWEQRHCIVNQTSNQLSASAVLLLMLRAAVIRRTPSLLDKLQPHGLILLMVWIFGLFYAQLDTLPGDVVHLIFSMQSPDNLIQFLELISIQRRPRRQCCSTISMVNEHLVTFKMSINLMSPRFDGTLTQRRIKPPSETHCTYYHPKVLPLR